MTNTQWPPPFECSLDERTRLWKAHRDETQSQQRKAPPSVKTESPEEDKPDRWWRPSEHFDDWIYKKVRVIKELGIPVGTLGVVIDWDDGMPMVWFTEKAAQNLTREDITAAWDSPEPPEVVFNFPLDHLEKVT